MFLWNISKHFSMFQKFRKSIKTICRDFNSLKMLQSFWYTKTWVKYISYHLSWKVSICNESFCFINALTVQDLDIVSVFHVGFLSPNCLYYFFQMICDSHFHRCNFFSCPIFLSKWGLLVLTVIPRSLYHYSENIFYTCSNIM